MGSHLWALSSPTFISLPATSLRRTNLRALALAGGETFAPCGSPRLPTATPSPPRPPRRPPATLRQRRAFAATWKSSKNNHSQVFLPKKVGHAIRRAGRSPGSVSTTNEGSHRDRAVSVSGMWHLLLASRRAHLSETRLLRKHPLLSGASFALQSIEDTPAVANPTGDPRCPPQRTILKLRRCRRLAGASPVPCQASRKRKSLPARMQGWMDGAGRCRGGAGHVPGTGAAAPSCVPLLCS